MKATILSLLLMLITFGANAETDFTCLDNTKKTGFAYELKEIYSNEETAQYTFLFKFGSCDAGALEAESLNRIKLKNVAKVYDDAFHWPFRKVLAEASVSDIGSDNEYQVTVNVHKRNYFKKKKKRNFGVNLRYNLKKHKFIFGFEAIIDKDGKLKLKLINKKAMKGFTV